MTVKLHGVERQAVGVGMVLAVFREALAAEFGRPGQHGESFGEEGGKVLKGPLRPASRGWGNGRRVAAVPNSREVGMAIGGFGSGGVHVG
jgi:hypothetical protein